MRSCYFALYEITEAVAPNDFADSNAPPVDNSSVFIGFSFLWFTAPKRKARRRVLFVKSHAAPAAQGLSSVAHSAKEENRSDKKAAGSNGPGESPALVFLKEDDEKDYRVHRRIQPVLRNEIVRLWNYGNVRLRNYGIEADYVSSAKLSNLIGEAEELSRILAASVITARGRRE